MAVDLGDPDGLHQAAQLLADRRAHLLVNNVGTATAGPFATTPLTHAHEMLRLNCEALVTLSHAFLAQARPGDALLNVSSTLAHAPLPDLAVYSATKAFVTAFSEALWSEHRASGIHVLALCPGMTATESQSHDDAPAALVQTPEQVVATALRALRRRSRPHGRTWHGQPPPPRRRPHPPPPPHPHRSRPHLNYPHSRETGRISEQPKTPAER
ncbi:SDR family NAD(P)-dependent oxidoreductase [Streptomyces zaomyceticus]|uniref:SDR family NAD(P)-dependent oxidoreductase n=1 Tax=Streptomyces zaomyceticus TaxID=68286 RepID=UPI0037B35EE0|nr:SDR family NAD(P)-dependent oxidoreductase [Streptomyces zaomyceticus]